MACLASHDCCEEANLDDARTWGPIEAILHLAVAACVLNDIYREAHRKGIPIDSVSVSADGGFGGDPVASTGITYSVEVMSPAPSEQVNELIEHVDRIAEIPNTLKRGTEVWRA